MRSTDLTPHYTHQVASITESNDPFTDQHSHEKSADNQVLAMDRIFSRLPGQDPDVSTHPAHDALSSQRQTAPARSEKCHPVLYAQPSVMCAAEEASSCQ